METPKLLLPTTQEDYETTFQDSLRLFAESIENALAVSEDEWPDDKEVTITLEFQLVPKLSCKINKR